MLNIQEQMEENCMKKVVSLLLCLIMTMSLLVGCGNNTGGTNEAADQSTNEVANETEETTAAEDVTVESFKIGVLVSDATTAEALAFRSYYENYIASVYPVEFVYSDELADSAAEKSAIDTFIANNCKAIISFSSFDRASQIEQCEGAGVYYAVATGTLTDEQFETYKSYEHYIGAIGPSLEDEYQTGYDMAMHYLEQGKTEFAIFGGAIPYYTDMHIYRAAGMLTAMADYTGGNYLGSTTKDDIIGTIYGTGDVQLTTIGNVSIVGYVGGYDMTDTWFADCGAMAQIEGLQVILAVGNGSDFFGAAIGGTDVKIASVDAYASSYGEAMAGGMLDYLAGKFSASIGPIFIATYCAVQAMPIRDADGNALALSQGYWVATSTEEFEKYYALDNSTDNPAYPKELLDEMIGADYNLFATFVSAYSFDDINSAK